MKKPRVVKVHGQWEASSDAGPVILTARADTVGRAWQLLREIEARRLSHAMRINDPLSRAVDMPL
jgi:hypothetical protein